MLFLYTTTMTFCVCVSIQLWSMNVIWPTHVLVSYRLLFFSEITDSNSISMAQIKGTTIEMNAGVFM